MGKGYRNAEGYFDPVAGAAIANVEKVEKMRINAGDIIRADKMTTNFGEFPFAVLAVNGPVFTGLRLYDTQIDGSIPVLCGAMMYAQPEKIEWMNSMKCDIAYQRTMNETEFQGLREAVSRSLGLAEPSPLVLETRETEEAATADISVSDAAYNEMVEHATRQAEEIIRLRERADIFEGLYNGIVKDWKRNG